MRDKPDPGRLKNPSGMKLSKPLKHVKQGRLRDPAAPRQDNRQHNKLAQPQNRWQRAVRYVWDKKRG